ncbi:MAG: hypothetical protein CR217_14655 [Beijerinckiaceae bacterium]|nr:MAG: hypothetical protein CR217_14655 [Beijerinckiaceae bacterium]
MFCPIQGCNLTKMLHVKHFGKIDTLGNRTFARRGEVRSGDLDLAQSDKIYFIGIRPFGKCFSGF